MPHISPYDRKRLANGYNATTGGELNYQLAQVVTQYIRDNGISYQSWSDVISALETLKLELARRFLAPYEDIKAKENGDALAVIQGLMQTKFPQAA